MHDKVFRPGKGCTRQYGLKLFPGLQPPRLHGALKSTAQNRYRALAERSGLDSQALAALGTTRVDHGAATTGLHADQETMGTRTADLGGLVSTFHLEILVISVEFFCHATVPTITGGTAHEMSRSHFCGLGLHLAALSGHITGFGKTIDYRKIFQCWQCLGFPSACST
jgi:hypothetical protein